MAAKEEIQTLLQAFQDGYMLQDINQLNSFMELFIPDAEIIGTNGIKPGQEEWYTSRDDARELVQGDWECWGELHLDLESASIRVNGETGWVAASATVTQTIGPENYASYLNFVKEFIEKSTLPPEEKLHYILRGGANTVYELGRGEKFIWPLRFTAVVIRQADSWKFAQVNFSFPTIYFPDVRVLESA
jgi:hypothetical protein